MRSPNGYGSIVKLPGKRRKPYAVRVTASLELVDGKFVQKRKYLGYYKTKAEALAVLENYHKDPSIVYKDVTFADLYKQWSEKKFREISESNQHGYQASFNSLAVLHDRDFCKLTPAELQSAIDATGKKPPTKKKMVTLISQLYKFAEFNQIIPAGANPAPLLSYGKMAKSDLHYRFNSQELKALWDHAEDMRVGMVLMMVYAGVRPGEMFELKKEDVHIDEQFFFIRNGKNPNARRLVPIADKVLPLYEDWMKLPGEYLLTDSNGGQINFRGDHANFMDVYWNPALESVGILEYKDPITGDSRKHMPDDVRHTFASMWADADLSEEKRRRIQGHKGVGIGEQVYTHNDIKILLDAVNKI